MLRRAAIAALTSAAFIAAAWAQGGPPATGFTGNPLVANGEHMVAGGNPPTAGAGCGTGAVVVGTDAWGHVLLGTGTSQPCVITFAQPFLLAPSCVVQAESFTVSYSRTITTLSLTSLVDGVRVSWSCISRAGGG